MKGKMIIAIACLLCVSVDPQDTEESHHGNYSIGIYVRLSRVFEYVPDWPSDRQFTDEEWQRVIASAVVLQKEKPHNVEMAILAHRLRRRSGMEAELEDTNYGDEVMLVLRMMFDIPNDASGDNRPFGRIVPCGGYSFRPAFADAPDEPIGAPVGWQDGQPVLTAFYYKRPRIIISGPPYYPLKEFRYFRKHFPARKGLIELLDNPVKNWLDVEKLYLANLRKGAEKRAGQ